MGGGKQYLAPPPYVWKNSLEKMFINKDNILDLIYIKFINTHFMGGAKHT